MQHRRDRLYLRFFPIHEGRGFANLINNAGHTHAASALIKGNCDYLLGSSGFKKRCPPPSDAFFSSTA